VVIAALLAGEELERLAVRADGIEALLLLNQRETGIRSIFSSYFRILAGQVERG